MNLIKLCVITLLFISNLAVGSIDHTDLNDNPRLIYVNPNLEISPLFEKQFLVTKRIPMGTILLIERPLIQSSNGIFILKEFIKDYASLWKKNGYFRDYINNIMPMLPSSIHLSDEQISTVHKAIANDTNAVQLAREYQNCNFTNKMLAAMHYLSWNSRLYSSLPLIQIGFDANIGIFEHPKSSLIVIVALTDLPKYRRLIQPIDLMKHMLYSNNNQFTQIADGIEDWKTMNVVHLSDIDKEELNSLWNKLKFIYQQFHWIRYNDTRASLENILLSDEYLQTMSSIYVNGFGPEVLSTRHLVKSREDAKAYSSHLNRLCKDSIYQIYPDLLETIEWLFARFDNTKMNYAMKLTITLTGSQTLLKNEEFVNRMIPELRRLLSSSRKRRRNDQEF